MTQSFSQGGIDFPGNNSGDIKHVLGTNRSGSSQPGCVQNMFSVSTFIAWKPIPTLRKILSRFSICYYFFWPHL